MNPRGIGPGWVALCLALALHVYDEAVTNFLAVYNPVAMAIREQAPWLPVPVFQFETWLAGLVFACLALLALSPFAFRDSRWLRPIAYAFAALMIVNALGHTLATIAGRSPTGMQFTRPMPGFYSSPFLLAASVYLLMQLRRQPALRTA